MGTDSKRRTIIKVLLIVFSILTVIGLGLLIQVFVRQSKEVEENNEEALKLEKEILVMQNEVQSLTEQKETLAAENEEIEARRNAEEEEAALEEAKKGIEGLDDLKAEISNYLDGRAGTWSVYVKNLNSREYLALNNQPLKAASLIKLYIMGAVYDQINKGNLEMTDTIYSLLNNMITISDNESANELVRQLSTTRDNFDEGMALVNEYAGANGFADTSQGRDLRDFREEPAPGENYSSAADCGRFLENVYNGTCVSESAASEMLGFLKAQQRKTKIPAGLPEGVESANKTGELSDTENDAAIVYGSSGTYILCVMSQDLPDVGSAQESIREMSGMVYRYFNETVMGEP